MPGFGVEKMKVNLTMKESYWLNQREVLSAKDREVMTENEVP